MGRTPFPDAGDVLGASEVGFVPRLSEPPTLALALAGLPTGRLETELLMPEIASFGLKQLVTAEAFASEGGLGHGEGRKSQAPRSGNQCRSGKSTKRRRRTKKEEEIDRRMAGRRRHRKNTRFSNRWNHPVFGSAFTAWE